MHLCVRVSVSDQVVSSVVLSPAGDWVGLACSGLGQLLVWEGQSETYILKQQGHQNNMTSLAYSPGGELLVTGGEDGKVRHYRGGRDWSMVGDGKVRH